jgi:uncharacterized membrane protein YfcA
VRRLIAVVLTTVLVAAAVLRSHLWPLCLLAVMGALIGVLLATCLSDPRDLRRVPALVVVAVLVLVGVGQLGMLGLGLGLVLLAVAMPEGSSRARTPR